MTTGDGIGSSLANQLTQLGEYCIMVSVGSHYQKLTSQSYTVNPLVADDFTKLFQESLENKPPLKGIVHLWSCESHSSTDLSLRSFTTSASYRLWWCLIFSSKHYCKNKVLNYPVCG
ncbi:MAG UNVERIFIED_CONTAM: hypothetical protein LVR29_23395 [Microcystis novacekii LVE1205-3]